MKSGIAAERLHYMDNLRALAMLVGVLFHAALAYSVLLHAVWPTADAASSVWVDIVVWFTHSFRMPLFFVVAGFFAALLVNQRGIGGMLSNRFARVLLPFVVCWPIVYFAMTWLFMHALTSVENLSPLLVLVKKLMAESNAPAAPPTLMHLWFLPYLMCFCVLVWVVTALELNWISRWFSQVRTSVLMGLVPLILALPLASVTAPFPAPESFFPQWWALMFFGLYFAIGYQWFRHPAAFDWLQPFAPTMVLGAVLAHAAACWLMQRQMTQYNAVLHVLHALLQAYAGFWMTLGCLVYGKKWLNRRNDFLRYISEASYWVYIVHLPILFAVQYPLLDHHASAPTKFAIAVFGTFGLAFASYHLLVRCTVVGRMLNGTRQANTTPRTKPGFSETPVPAQPARFASRSPSSQDPNT